jgi:myxalamid-type polyketide synthase MxaE and MxaD
VLRAGTDAIDTVPADRWDVNAYYDANPEAAGKAHTRWAALLDTVDAFDPQFFGISPREATHMDPQHRLLLETAWEAIEHAGIPANLLRGSQAGVFVGIGSDDYLQLGMHLAHAAEIDAYAALGTARSIAAGRIAHTLGLRGPAIQLDTSCSSSLVAVHLACQSLPRRMRSCACRRRSPNAVAARIDRAIEGASGLARRAIACLRRGRERLRTR